jgi:hypothetical protein
MSALAAFSLQCFAAGLLFTTGAAIALSFIFA